MEKPAKPMSRHKMTATMARIKLQGMSVIDKRTLAAQAVLGWQEDLIDDLGGAAAVSTAQKTLVELAVRTRLMLENVDAFIMRQPSLVNKAKRSIYPIVRERNSLANTLTNILAQLGLERRERDLGNIRQYLDERKEGGDEHHSGDERPEAVRADVPAEEGIPAEGESGQLGGVEGVFEQPVRASDEPGAGGDLPEAHTAE